MAIMKKNNAIQVQSKKLVLLIHGLAGSPFTTWVEILACLSKDVDLQELELDCYEFPTSLLRWAFFSRRASIEELASGLDTYIRTMHSDKNEVVLVGHSLGGVIARKYILEKVKISEHSIVKGLLLIAVPNTGASLARLATALSWNNRHAKQLCKGSNFLDNLNVEWLKLRVESRIRTRYIVGASDAVVTPESGKAYAGMSDVRTLVSHGHRSILNASSNEDIRYRVVQNFLATVFEGSHENHAGEIAEKLLQRDEVQLEPAEVLFEVYSKRVEPFYCGRDIDPILSEAISCGHVWVVGPSGVGKTTSLRHTIEQKGWHIEHIMLASIQNATTIGLARHICNYLYERAGLINEFVPLTDGMPEILRRLQIVLRNIAKHDSLVIFIEEIPLQLGVEYSNFMAFVAHLTSLAESEGGNYRLTWVFSSILNPQQEIISGRDKFLNRVIFVNLDRWRDDELNGLFDLIQENLKVAMNDYQKKRVIEKANGCPRFVKNVFRKRRQEVGVKMPFDVFLESIDSE